MASVNWPHSRSEKWHCTMQTQIVSHFKEIAHEFHTIWSTDLKPVLFNCTHHSALQVFDNRISGVNSLTCCFMMFFAIATAPLLVLAQKAEEMAISYQDGRQAAIFSYTTCIHKMVCKVNLTDDFSAKEAGIGLKLAECMQKICINLNPQKHKNRSYALKCDFYWRLSHII